MPIPSTAMSSAAADYQKRNKNLLFPVIPGVTDANGVVPGTPSAIQKTYMGLAKMAPAVGNAGSVINALSPIAGLANSPTSALGIPPVMARYAAASPSAAPATRPSAAPSSTMSSAPTPVGTPGSAGTSAPAANPLSDPAVARAYLGLTRQQAEKNLQFGDYMMSPYKGATPEQIANYKANRLGAVSGIRDLNAEVTASDNSKLSGPLGTAYGYARDRLANTRMAGEEYRTRSLEQARNTDLAQGAADEAQAKSRAVQAGFVNDPEYVKALKASMVSQAQGGAAVAGAQARTQIRKAALGAAGLDNQQSYDQFHQMASSLFKRSQLGGSDTEDAVHQFNTTILPHLKTLADNDPATAAQEAMGMLSELGPDDSGGLGKQIWETIKGTLVFGGDDPRYLDELAQRGGIRAALKAIVDRANGGQ